MKNLTGGGDKSEICNLAKALTSDIEQIGIKQGGKPLKGELINL
tara:strand:- start:9 stop:140 length:132 start_codon:yes stop_codon:yes gene_type:complete